MDQPNQDGERNGPDQRSPEVPQVGERPRLRDLPWLVRYSLRGLWELVRARIAFASFSARDIPRLNATARAKERGAVLACDEHVDRIGYVLPRLSSRLPWRSDCLIQAMAGQNWLRAGGLASEIQIGVEKPKDGPFGAHAWLVHREKVVTGGKIDRYARILGEDPIRE